MMQKTISKLMIEGKGILAADESLPTMKKRLSGVGINSIPENRHIYRRTIFSAKGLDKYISGTILFDETIRNEKTIEPLLDSDIVLGIKVDRGAKRYDNRGGKLTEGLDGLSERLQEYRQLGAEFAKWRAILGVNDTGDCIYANTKALAIYAKKCQQEGIVPIVEPEISMEGSHSICRSREATEKVLRRTFDALYYEGVELENMLLKPNMVLSGYSSNRRESSLYVASTTIECFKRVVPAAVPMIAFLSGGQPDEEALENLNTMNKGRLPWYVSFSFGRALQSGALELCGKGKTFEAQEWIISRAEECSKAAKGVL